MQEDANDITDLNYMGLVVPKDGEVAVVADGCSTWAPVPDLDPLGRDDGEHWLPMNYEPVLSADGKLLDVVAWVETDPGFWWFRTGRGIILGAAELARVSWTDLPCILVSSPAGWRHLQRTPQQSQSICVLDWGKADIGDLFGTVWGTIYCASPALEKRFLDRSAAAGLKLDLSIAELAFDIE